jgi:hypothetical protein
MQCEVAFFLSHLNLMDQHQLLKEDAHNLENPLDLYHVFFHLYLQKVPKLHAKEQSARYWLSIPN